MAADHETTARAVVASGAHFWWDIANDPRTHAAVKWAAWSDDCPEELAAAMAATLCSWGLAQSFDVRELIYTLLAGPAGKQPSFAFLLGMVEAIPAPTVYRWQDKVVTWLSLSTAWPTIQALARVKWSL